MLSLLPHLPSELALVVDMNSAVLDYTALIAELIKQANSPSEVLEQLTVVENPTANSILSELVSSTYKEDAVYCRGELTKESDIAGSVHWSQEQSFPLVRAALATKPIVFVQANITHPEFGRRLSDICRQHNLFINFANLTNVHMWLDREYRGMEFIRNWPWDPDAVILASTFIDSQVPRIFPQVSLVHSVDEYIDLISRDPVMHN